MPKGIRNGQAAILRQQQHTLVPKGATTFPGTSTPLPQGVAVRSSTGVQIEFMYQGQRCTETLGGTPTIAHVLAAAEKRRRVTQLVGLGKFNYADEFPDSPRVRRAAQPDASLPKAMTVGDALDEWLLHMKSTVGPNAYKDYQKDSRYLKSIPLYMFDGLDVPAARRRSGQLQDLPVLQLTDTGIVHFRAWLLAKPLSVKRIGNLLIPLRGIARRLHSRGDLPNNPFDDVRPLVETAPALHQPALAGDPDLDAPLPLEDIAQFKGEDGLPDPFTPEESAAILNQLSGPFYNQILFWLWTGLRTGELIALRWSDIDLPRKRIYIRRSLSRGILTFPKCRRARWVDLTPPAMAALTAQFAHTGQAREWVFPNPWTGQRWANESKIRSRFKKACELAGVRYRRPYHCRHTFASTLLSAGENHLYVAEQMGHKDWTMISQVYGRWIRQVDHQVGERLAQQHGAAWAALDAQIAARQTPLTDLSEEDAVEDRLGLTEPEAPEDE